MYDTYSAKIHINNSKPIKVEHLVAFFCAIQKEYNSTVGKKYKIQIENCKPELAISEVHYGSQIYELVVISTMVMYPSLVEYTIVDYFNYFWTFLSVFINNALDNLNTSRKECLTARNFSNIFLEDANLNIDISILKNKQPVKQIVIKNNDGRQIHEKAVARLQLLEAEKINAFKNNHLYFYQTRNVSSSSPGDKAIIPSISDKPKKVIFVNDTLKQKVLDADKNIYRNLYSVSGTVEYSGDNVKLYKIESIEYLRGRDE